MTLGKRGWIALLAAVLVAPPAFAQEPTPVNRPEDLGFAADRLERLTHAFQGYVDSGQLPGAVVLIARDDKVAYFKAFGYRDREKKVGDDDGYDFPARLDDQANRQWPPR